MIWSRTNARQKNYATEHRNENKKTTECGLMNRRQCRLKTKPLHATVLLFYGIRLLWNALYFLVRLPSPAACALTSPLIPPIAFWLDRFKWVWELKCNFLHSSLLLTHSLFHSALTVISIETSISFCCAIMKWWVLSIDFDDVIKSFAFIRCYLPFTGFISNYWLKFTWKQNWIRQTKEIAWNWRLKRKYWIDWHEESIASRQNKRTEKNKKK